MTPAPNPDVDRIAPSGVSTLVAEAPRFKRTVLATCCVPWAAPFDFDEAMFRRSVRGLLFRGLRDLYVFGTAGEGHAVSDSMFARVVDAFLDEMGAHGATPMVGLISGSLATMRDRARYCVERGCTTFQFATSPWGGNGPTEFRSVLAQLCSEFPEASFLHYNTPRSGRVVGAREYSELAADFPNLVGTKYGGGDPEVVTSLVVQTPQLRHFFTELGFYYGSAVGPCGLLASVSSTNPRRARAYLRNAEDGAGATLAADFAELAAMMAALRQAVGPVPLVDGAYDKVLAKILEPEFPLSLLPPQVEGAPDAWETYRQFLEARFPDWLPDVVSEP